MSTLEYRIRTATPGDRAAILDMQKWSIRSIGRKCYAPEVIESAIRHFGTMDPEVIDEGAFYVAVTDAGDILGTGGWSRRVPGYDRIDRAHAESEADFLQRHYIRGVYVRPDRARQGIARAIMAHAEATAAESGAPALTLTATLSGVPLYKALDYRAVQSKVVRLPDGLIFEAVEMTKAIASPIVQRATGSARE